MTPDVSSKRVSERPSAEPSESDDYPLIETQRLTRTVLVEADVKNTSAPDAIRTPSDLPVSSQSGLSNQDEKELRHERKEPRALEARKDSIELTAHEPLTETIAPKRKLAPEDPAVGPLQLPVQGEAPQPPPLVERKEMPTLYPSPPPSLPETPQPERPRLVIGRLHVEVVPPPKESPPTPTTVKPIRRMRSRTPGHQPAHSKLRFGLGQL